MASYSTVAEVAEKFANQTGLDAQASFDSWKAALESLCADRDKLLQGMKQPALKRRAQLDLEDSRSALRFISQKSLFEKLGQFAAAKQRHRYLGLLEKPESKALIPNSSEPTYDDWMALLDAEPPPAPPPMPVFVPPPPPVAEAPPVIEAKPVVQPSPPPAAPAPAPKPVVEVKAAVPPPTPPPPVLPPAPPLIVVQSEASPPPPRAPLAIKISNPVDGSVFNDGDKIDIKVKARAPGEILTVEYFVNNRQLGMSLNPPWNYEWTPQAGPNVVVAKVTDKNGRIAESRPVRIHSAPRQAPLGAPVKFTAKGMPQEVLLKWDAPAGTRPVGYRIERSDPGGNGFKSITTQPVSATKFTDAAVLPGASYAYRVYAIDAEGSRGPGSPEATAVALPPVHHPPAIQIVQPAAGSELTAGVETVITTQVTAAKGVASVEFLIDNKHEGSANGEPYALKWTPGTEGSFALKAMVTDTIGVKASSPEVRVAVKGASKAAVIAPRPRKKSWMAVAALVLLVALWGMAKVAPQVFTFASKKEAPVTPPAAATSAEVAVHSSPPAQEVYVDKARVELSPSGTITVASGGLHEISVRAPGYRSASTNVAIVPGQSRSIYFGDLVAEAGLQIETDPPGAAMTVDGETMSRAAPFKVTVEPGVKHIVRAAIGGSAQEQEAMAAPGETRLVKFVFDAWLAVRTEPEGATVIVDGAVQNQTTPAAIKLAPGQHSVGVKLYGYRQPEALQRTLQAGATNVADFGGLTKADPEYSMLTITSHPSGASIWLDDKLQAERTPSYALRVGAGRHNVAVQAEGYAAQARQFTARPPEVVALDFGSLAPLKGIVRLTSAPSQVVVRSGSFTDMTPCSFEAAPGRYKLEFSKTGYWPLATNVEVTAGGEARALEVALGPRPLQVMVTSNPKANLSIENSPRGETGAFVEVPWGEHLLHFATHADGYLDGSIYKKFAADDPNPTVAFGDLKKASPAGGMVQVFIDPPEGSIYVNDKLIGKGAARFQAPAGKSCSVIGQAAGYETQWQTVFIEAGTTKTVSFRLKRASPSTPSKTP